MEVPNVSTTTDDWEEIDLDGDVTPLDDAAAHRAGDGGVVTCCQPYRADE